MKVKMAVRRPVFGIGLGVSSTWELWVSVLGPDGGDFEHLCTMQAVSRV